MLEQKSNQLLNQALFQDDYLTTWIASFLLDRKAAGVTAGTLRLYRVMLEPFSRYCDAQAITQISQITAEALRRYLLNLEEAGHNPGGIHIHYRAVKTFLLWWESETEPEGWKNPIRKVKAPRLAIEPLEPVSMDTIRALLDTCEKGTFHGARDRAALLVLLDTGARAAEFCALNLADYNPITGEALIRQGKGRKPRNVYFSAPTRRAVRAYLKTRQYDNPALWVTGDGERLSYWGLNEIIRRRSKVAGVEKPELHDFRRAFALSMLRAGVDIFSLQKLMGHADLQVLRRYLAQTDQDTLAAHRKGSPVEGLE